MTNIDRINRNPFGPLVQVNRISRPPTVSSICFQEVLGIEASQQVMGRKERTRPGGADSNYQAGDGKVDPNRVDRVVQLINLYKEGYTGIDPRIIHQEEVLVRVQVENMAAKVRAPLKAVKRRVPNLAI